MNKRRVTMVVLALAGVLLGGLPAWAQEKDEESVQEFQGSVEVKYRNVDVNGSDRRYDEDFDGLATGAVISNLFLDWRDLGLSGIDYARVNAGGLGGDPYQNFGVRFGRKDRYDLTLDYRKQDYLYNMFGLYGDEDGHTWNTDRRFTNLKFTYFVAPRANVFLEVRDNDRGGDSIVMKDINRDLFRLDTPVDANETRYAVGTNVGVGPVDIYFRQTLRDFENDIDNTTEGNLGLDTGNLASLSSYDWRQTERGEANWTELKLHAGLGRRVDLTVGYFGNLIGEEELSTSVSVNADGTSFTGTCAVGGTGCSTDADCDAIIAGDVCVADPFAIVDGFSSTESEADTTLGTIDLSWTVIEPVILHVEYRTLQRDVTSIGTQDLSGTGTPSAVNTKMDWSVDTVTAIVEAHPIRTFSFDIGFRVVDRSLDRNGFGGSRDENFDSVGDQSLVVGLNWRPIDWFRLDADYEDADIDQPFTNVSLFESERTRVKALFTPFDGKMRIDLQYLGFENTNTASDFRTTNTFFGSSIDGTTWSGSLWYQPSQIVDFLIRFAEQDVDTVANVVFDTAGFGGTDSGVDIFDNTNKEALFRLNLRWTEPWLLYLQYWLTDSDGANPLIASSGANVNCLPGGTGAVCSPLIGQEYTDAEIGLRYTFDTGIYVGGSYRDFDYDDINQLVDYDGTIVSILAGVTF